MAACKEQNRLIEESHKAVRVYSDSVKSMTDLAVLPTVEFEYMRAFVEKARYISREARERLRAHIAQHGC